MNHIRMFYFERIDVFKGINVKKTSTPKECDICHIGIS